MSKMKDMKAPLEFHKWAKTQSAIKGITMTEFLRKLPDYESMKLQDLRSDDFDRNKRRKGRGGFVLDF